MNDDVSLYTEFEKQLLIKFDKKPTQEQINQCMDIYKTIRSYTPGYIENGKFDPPVDFFYFLNFAFLGEFLYAETDKQRIREAAILKPFALYLKDQRKNIKEEGEWFNTVGDFSMDYVINNSKYDEEHMKNLFGSMSVFQQSDKQADKVSASTGQQIFISDDSDETEKNDFLESLETTVKQIFPSRFDTLTQIYTNTEAYKKLIKVITEIQNNINNEQKTVTNLATDITEAVASVTTPGEKDKVAKLIINAAAEIS